MRIIVVGGNGTIGKDVVDTLKVDHEVIIAGRSSGEIKVDISDSTSIESMYKFSGKVDAVVCVAGEAKWATMKEMSEEDYYVGVRSKLMGQVNLVRLGISYVNPGGSFTLTSGILADDPVLMTTSAAMVNGALHSFIKAASLELDLDRRINVVSAGLVEKSEEKYRTFFPGHNAVPMKRVVNGYLKSILGHINGQVIRID